MNRVIKFRAWNPKIGMSEIVSLEFAHGLRLIPADIDKGRNDISDDQWVLMQFTGLKDRHGKEIYEGDIVKVSPDEGENWDVGEVIYGSYASFNVYLSKVGTGIKSPLLNFCVGTMGIGCADIYIKVIGNIYENPELLK